MIEHGEPAPPSDQSGPDALLDGARGELADRRESDATADGPLTQASIFRFYFPLAASWIFMALEAPIGVAVLSRLPQPTISTAAYFVVMSLSLWIESPIIDLLATSTTLSVNRERFMLLRRFTSMLMVWVTVVHLAVLEPHLFNLLAYKVFELPVEVANSAYLGMCIMVPWSAFIAWRRFLQGILIRHGHTRVVGIGTAVRVCTMSCVALGLYAFNAMPGIAIVATALVCSVASEALFAHWASRSVVNQPDADPVVAVEPMTLRRLAAFHFPLTGTTMVTMAAFPIVTYFLSRTPNATLTLASWQVATALLFLARTIVFALPEVVISLHRNAESEQQLRRFCLNVGLGASCAMAVVAAIGLDSFLFERVLDAQPEVATRAHIAFWTGALMPAIGAVQSYLRGMLTLHHRTGARLWAILAGVLVLVALLAMGIRTSLPGVAVASIATTGAMLVELGVLAGFWMMRTPSFERGHPTPAKRQDRDSSA